MRLRARRAGRTRSQWNAARWATAPPLLRTRRRLLVRLHKSLRKNAGRGDCDLRNEADERAREEPSSLFQTRRRRRHKLLLGQALPPMLLVRRGAAHARP